MKSRKTWTDVEIERLIRAYPILTINELRLLFPDCTVDMINSKVRRLKQQGLITQNKDLKTRNAAMKQRVWPRQVKPGVFNRNPDSWIKGEIKK